MVDGQLMPLDQVEIVGAGKLGWSGLLAIARNVPEIMELVREFGRAEARVSETRGVNQFDLFKPVSEEGETVRDLPELPDNLLAVARKVIVREWIRKPWRNFETADFAADSGKFDVVRACMVALRRRQRSEQEREHYVAVSAYNWCRMERRREWREGRFLVPLDAFGEEVL